MKRLAALALVAAALFLTACSSIDEGTITQKASEPGYYVSSQTCVAYNKEGVCSQWMPTTTYYPPTWRFDIRQGDDKGWVYVSEDTYNDYEVGDYFGSPR